MMAVKATKKTAYDKDSSITPASLMTTPDHLLPQVELERIETAKPGVDLKVTAKVSGNAGVKSIKLCFRPVNQFEDYQSLEMKSNASKGLYEAIIPGEFIVNKYDLMYFIQVIDKKGNGWIIPDLDIETPYVIVKLDRNKLKSAK